jgi:hypothetical protein
MILAVGYFQDVHSHDSDASDFSNVPRNLITSRLDPECTAVFNKMKSIPLKLQLRRRKKSHLARTILTFDSPFRRASRINFSQSDFKPIRRVFSSHGLHGTG